MTHSGGNYTYVSMNRTTKVKFSETNLKWNCSFKLWTCFTYSLCRNSRRNLNYVILRPSFTQEKLQFEMDCNFWTGAVFVNDKECFKYLWVYLQNKSVPMLTIKYFAVHKNSTNWSVALSMMHGGRRDTPGSTLRIRIRVVLGIILVLANLSWSK